MDLPKFNFKIFTSHNSNINNEIFAKKCAFFSNVVGIKLFEPGLGAGGNVLICSDALYRQMKIVFDARASQNRIGNFLEGIIISLCYHVYDTLINYTTTLSQWINYTILYDVIVDINYNINICLHVYGQYVYDMQMINSRVISRWFPNIESEYGN